jgi:hypothetical protein
MRVCLFVAVTVLFAAACSPSDAPAPAAVGNTPAASPGPGRDTVIGQAPPGSVVILEPVVPRDAALPAGPAILDQYARNFVPDLLLVRVGQRVEFRNSEDVDHNVAVVRSPTGTKVFDTSTPPYQKHEYTFDTAGRYEVSCDVHPGMRATIVATTTPHAVVVDASGRFVFADIEPGAYKLILSGTRTLERAIELTGAPLDLGRLVP